MVNSGGPAACVRNETVISHSLKRIGARLRRLDDRVLGPVRPDAPDPLRRLGVLLTFFGGLHTAAWLVGLAGSTPWSLTMLGSGVVVLLVAHRRPPAGRGGPGGGGRGAGPGGR